MERCKTCKHWTGDSFDGFRTCEHPKFHYSYHTTPDEIQPDEIIIEPDEGWGMYSGPEFGCVHHEK